MARIKRQVLFWVPSKKADKGNAGKPLEHETITEDELISEYGVPHYIIQDHLKTEVQQEAACKTVPFTLLLVVSYAWMVIAHMDAPVLRAVEESVRADIEDNANFAFDSLFFGHKDIEDVNSYADFWSFMQKGLIPLLFIQERPWSEEVVEEHLYADWSRRLHEDNSEELDSFGWAGDSYNARHLTDGQRPVTPLATTDLGLHLHYNRIVGGIRLRQERNEAFQCFGGSEPGLASFYGKPCTDDRYPTDPDMNEARQTDADELATRWIWVNSSLADMQAQLVDMELSQWLDRQTAKIEIGIPIYNGEYGLHSLVCGTSTSPVAGASGSTSFRSLATFGGTVDGTITSLTLSMQAVSCGSWAQRFGLYSAHVALMAAAALRDHYFNVWNLIDWLSVLTGIILMWLLFTVITFTMDLNGIAESITSPVPLDTAKAISYVDKLEEASDWVIITQRSLAYYPMIIVFRLFKAFHAQPRLALVTMTLRDCMQDLLHFLVVFICVFLGFVTSGLVLFGRDNDNFATFPRSCLACSRLLLGDIEWDELKVSSRLIAGLWIVAFFVVMVQLLLNMLLAVIMDSYSEVKEQAGSARTLFAETLHLCAKWWAAKQGNYVPLYVIMNAMDHALEVKLGEKMTNRRRRGRITGGSYGSGESPNMGVAQSEATEGITEDVYRAQIGRTPLFVADLISLTGNHKLIITGSKGVALSQMQAQLILKEAALKYYDHNKERVDMAEVLTVSRKVEAVMKGLVKSWWSAHRNGPNMDDSSNDVDRLLTEMRSSVERFLDDVQREREAAAKTLARLRVEVASLQDWAKYSRPVGLSVSGAERLRAAQKETARAQAAARGGGRGRLQPLEEEPLGNGFEEQARARKSTRRSSTGSARQEGLNGSAGAGDFIGDVFRDGGLLPAGWQQGEVRDGINLDWPDGVSLPSSRGSKASGKSSASGSGKGSSVSSLEDSGSEDPSDDVPPAPAGAARAAVAAASGPRLTDNALRQATAQETPPPSAFEFTNFKDAQSQI
eukprot:CAMPEP_0178390556 /NCGR_PEP_ID=MMETSP0689_2-20121128/10708_1 /TAXON_ID=160604 /ORGANISM="Amphidinium massartii, Strain CS-259" /LENGTH=1012 /DNA_ID=CAMNT_0020011071 /DNA_START=36 /DNA_END=3074 /DNA_ORIENTATION=+